MSAITIDEKQKKPLVLASVIQIIAFPCGNASKSSAIISELLNCIDKSSRKSLTSCPFYPDIVSNK